MNSRCTEPRRYRHSGKSMLRCRFYLKRKIIVNYWSYTLQLLLYIVRCTESENIWQLDTVIIGRKESGNIWQLDIVIRRKESGTIWSCYGL